MNLTEQRLAEKLRDRELSGNLRKLRWNYANVDLFSNDYLGFATTGVLQREIDKYPGSSKTGSTGSRLLSGNSREAESLEDAIATFHHAAAALLFNSGYDANIGLLTAIAGRHTVYIYDELCHASIIDGIRLSQSHNKYRFRHNDLVHLEERLASEKGDNEIIVVVESVYSMDGDMAPLKNIVELTEKYGAALIVDEAHATGVIGDRGEGLVAMLGLTDKVFARVHTFGKTLGCHGAAVLGSKRLKDYLVNFARSFIYTTALPPQSIVTARCAYDHLSSPVFSNKGLHELIQYFRAQTGKSGYTNWKDSTTPIQALIIGDNTKAKELALKIQQAGLQISPILSPTVPKGMERLRICLHSFNTQEEVDRLMSVLNTNA